MKMSQTWKKNTPTTIDGYSLSITTTFSSMDSAEIEELEKRMHSGVLFSDLVEQKKKPMFVCTRCGGEAIWGNDFSFEDYCLEGEGIVSNYTCTECGSMIEVYTPFENEEDNDGEG